MQAKSHHNRMSDAGRAHPVVHPPRHPLLVAALTCLFFLAAALILALPSMTAPFFWDDLHLIRVHTPAELAQVWTGSWDTDNIETPGFRPLTTYFNHSRALIFGESLIGHRLLLLVLFSIVLAVAAELARLLFAAGIWQRLLGGLLGLLHIRSVYHYLWISDGIHLLTTLFMLGAILSFLHALTSGRRMWWAISFVCTALALLTREDALAVLILLPCFGAALLLARRASGGWMHLPVAHLVLYAAAILSLASTYWAWRAAISLDSAPTSVPAGWVWSLLQIPRVAGDRQLLAQPWPAYAQLLNVWDFWLAGFVGLVLLGIRRATRLQVLLWLVAAAISALPLMVSARTNLLLLPVVFWGLLLAAALTASWQQASTAIARALAGGLLLVALGAGAFASVQLQREQRLHNLSVMCRNAASLYGVYGQLSIPPARRLALQASLEHFGISDLEDFKTRWPALERQAMVEQRIGFSSQGLPFVPRLEFLQQYGTHPRCEPPG